jgi:hypothetical protein
VSARATAAVALRLSAGRGALARGVDVVERLPVTRVLAGLVVVEWVAVLATALVVRHAGWIYYQGGDQLWYYTLGWLLGHGELTRTGVGYLWSALMAPLARIAGPNLVSALPAVELFDVLVLLPVGMFALYGIAARIGGRLFGYWAVLAWIAVPFIGIRYTNLGYHQRYTELLLPQAFGLTGLADFPTMVAALVSVYFCTRALFDEHPHFVDGVAAGVAAGAAIAIKPASVLFLAGPALAFAYRRRFAIAGAALAGLAPAVVTLTLWKARGLGHIPLLSFGHLGGLAATLPLAGLNLGRYVHNLSWPRFTHNLDLLREHFWSARLIEWLVIAGLIGLARRSRAAAVLVGGWFFAFAIVKGSYVDSSIEDGSLFRIMMPAFPAFILLLASVPLLLPHMPARLRAWRPSFVQPSVRLRWKAVAAALVVTAAAPLAAIAAARTHGAVDRTTIGQNFVPVPANIDLHLTASVRRRQVVLTWSHPRPLGGPVFYRIWRADNPGLSCPPTSSASWCNVDMPEIGTTHGGSFMDRAPKGRWVYRVAVAANWLNDPQYGDPYLVSRPLTVIVP